MTKVEPQTTLAPVLIERWEQSCRKIAELGDAFPANEFESRPFEGVRTCSEVLRHVAFWNSYVADSLRGKEVDGAANELPQSVYPVKASILKALVRASEDAASAIREASLDPKSVELILSFIEHTSEHYGQLAVYARSKGIVPPASRG